MNSTHRKLALNKSAKTNWGKNNLLTNGAGHLDIYMQKRVKLGSYSKPSTKINSKRIKDLNVRTNPVKLRRGNPHHLRSDEFLDMAPKAQATKENGR